MEPKTTLENARSAATWVGVSLTEHQEGALLRFADWLIGEAIPAGGLGPAEAARVGTRHLADSLLFAVGWRDRPHPVSLVDLGSGVGLPGIPLAVAFPATSVVLLDRSGRRTELARRAVRVVGLDNVVVVRDDIEDHGGTYPAAVARAARPPQQLLPVLRRLVSPGGCALVGGHWGWGEDPGEPPPSGFAAITVPPQVLDSPIRLLRMIADNG
jgi:16S rRNA (guanine527-N7)-methyltransferase